ncbi:MAG TPA: methyltransferase domain-containing protein [Terriglobales bacterium]|nr:methyltransferase domain-containing protein [Terriglobales bacterium]
MTHRFKAGSRPIDFYDRHPIDEAHVRAAAAHRRGGGRLAADDLFEFDQDHYGGIAAVDTLARRAGVRATSRVLDVCAGLGGPARFLASRRGCQVVALELHAGRAGAAARLTRDVALSRHVRVVRGDAVALPFRAAAFDACLSQEGLLHIADKAAVLAECRRVLVPGGRLAFTDWIAHPSLGDAERARLERWMAATTLQSVESYRAMLGRAGFGAVEGEDVADEWRPVLRARVERYRAERPDVVARFGPTWAEEYARLFGFFVALVEAGKLGGGRFSGTA